LIAFGCISLPHSRSFNGVMGGYLKYLAAVKLDVMVWPDDSDIGTGLM